MVYFEVVGCVVGELVCDWGGDDVCYIFGEYEC